MQESVTINRTYKDRLFKIIFEDKKELLSLYNALTGKNYQNPDELEINTIDDVIYMHLKNDMSFILDDWQNLFEQQSTFNPNQPLRGFFYFADLYKVKYFGKKIYSTRLLKSQLRNTSSSTMALRICRIKRNCVYPMPSNSLPPNLILKWSPTCSTSTMGIIRNSWSVAGS